MSGWRQRVAEVLAELSEQASAAEIAKIAKTRPPTIATVGLGHSGDFCSGPLVPAVNWSERAAVAEIDGGAPRAWAEWLATLQCEVPPAGVSAEAWLRAIDAAGRFLDQWGQTARSLGWSPGELMALLSSPDKFAEVTVVAITDKALTVRDGGGTVRVIYRRGRCDKSISTRTKPKG